MCCSRTNKNVEISQSILPVCISLFKKFDKDNTKTTKKDTVDLIYGNRYKIFLDKI